MHEGISITVTNESTLLQILRTIAAAILGGITTYVASWGIERNKFILKDIYELNEKIDELMMVDEKIKRYIKLCSLKYQQSDILADELLKQYGDVNLSLLLEQRKSISKGITNLCYKTLIPDKIIKKLMNLFNEDKDKINHAIYMIDYSIGAIERDIYFGKDNNKINVNMLKNINTFYEDLYGNKSDNEVWVDGKVDYFHKQLTNIKDLLDKIKFKIKSPFKSYIKKWKNI